MIIKTAGQRELEHRQKLQSCVQMIEKVFPGFVPTLLLLEPNLGAMSHISGLKPEHLVIVLRELADRIEARNTLPEQTLEPETDCVGAA